MNWYKQQRMKWIGECLDVYGYINRAHLVRKFGISIPQAANDLGEFRKANPEKIEYDTKLKQYKAIRKRSNAARFQRKTL